MSRSYHGIGLTSEALKWIEDNCVKEPDLICPHCQKTISEKVKIISKKHADCFYGDGPDLRKMVTHGGEIVQEVIQTSPWSGGPVVFLCLEINGKKQFKWSEAEIESYL